MRFLIAAIVAFLPFCALANDSMAELKTGGLSYVRTDAVSMLREDLYISMDKVQVDYLFQNTTTEDVSSIVAFPMPDIKGDPYEMSAMPRDDVDNFLAFSVLIDGQPVSPALEQRALAFGLDVTNVLRQYNIPLLPTGTPTFDALMNLPVDIISDWTDRGIIVNDIYDSGQGMMDHPTPIWTLQSTYWWRATFPANQTVNVQHTYTPSVGGSAGLTFLTWEDERSEAFDDYVEKYCVDSGFEKAVKRKNAQMVAGESVISETWLSYILKTGQNWSGPIGTFHLTVDKGSTENLVSFCGDGVTKTGPTTFELTYENFYPDRDLDVLILRSFSAQ